MKRPVETSSRSGAHFLRSRVGGAPIFVPPSGGRAAPDAGVEPRTPGEAAPAGPADPDPEVPADDPGRARRLGRQLFRSGRIRALADFAEELERDAWELGNHRTRAIARVLSGQAALEAGRLRFAEMRFASLVDLPLHPLDETQDIVDTARTGTGRVVLARGRPGEALLRFREVNSDPGGADPRIPIAALRGMAEAYLRLDCPDTAVTRFRRALHLAREAEARLEAALAAAGLARAEIALQGSDSDPRQVRLAMAAADLADSPLARIAALRARAAELRAEAAEEADPSRRTTLGEQALEELRDALAVALQIGSLLRQARVERDAAAVLDTLGRPARAEARRVRAREMLGRSGPPR